MGMEKMGLPVRPEYIVGGEFLEDAAYRATVELLSRPERPTAIIAHNNLMCIGAYRALRDMRINIPAEISPVSYTHLDVYKRQGAECAQRADTMTVEFMESLGEIRRMLTQYIKAACEGDPAAIYTEEILLSYPSVEAVSVYRMRCV